MDVFHLAVQPTRNEVDGAMLIAIYTRPVMSVVSMPS
jgi:hypothetical protein